MKIKEVITRLPIFAEREKKRKILEKFEVVGGNTSFRHARIIGLGELHIREHEISIGEFINAYAREGDIVLVEGVAMNQPVRKDGPKQTTYNFPKEVTVLGWDDMSLHQTAKIGMRVIYALLKKAKEAHNQYEDEKAVQYLKLSESFQAKIDDVKRRQRNLSLIATLEDVKNKHPKNRIFIIAGERHFTHDQHLKDTLDQDKYVVFAPKYQLDHEIFLEEARKRYS